MKRTKLQPWVILMPAGWEPELCELCPYDCEKGCPPFLLKAKPATMQNDGDICDGDCTIYAVKP